MPMLKWRPEQVLLVPVMIAFDACSLLRVARKIVRLKKELHALRQKHAAAIGASQETGDRQSNTTQSLLAPSVDIKQLVFSVDRFIAIGEPEHLTMCGSR